MLRCFPFVCLLCSCRSTNQLMQIFPSIHPRASLHAAILVLNRDVEVSHIFYDGLFKGRNEYTQKDCEAKTQDNVKSGKMVFHGLWVL